MQTSIDKAFQQLKVKVPSAEHSLRDQAFSYFKDKGLPTRKDENWKYTSLAFLTKSDWGLPQATRNFDQSLLHPDFFHIVFVNGQYQAELSDSVPGLRIEESDLVPRSFKSGMTALNWAMTPKAIKITVEKSVSITKPLQVLYWTESDLPALVSSRVEFHLEESSRLVLAEHFAGQGQVTSNARTEMHLGKNSRLSYVHVQEQSLQSYHLGVTKYLVGEGAHLESLSISLGALLARHSQDFCLHQPHSHVRSLGLYVVSGKQHSDHTGIIDHRVGACTSYQIYKGLLADQSRAIFNGRVLIREGSQKAFSEQSNKNLLMSTGAEIDSKPQLEIFADDVQARHGSTVGQINKEELFYLNSRGISQDKALGLLSFGFLSDILYQLSEESLTSWLKPKLEKALANIKVEGL